MLEKAQALARMHADGLVAAAIEAARAELDGEHGRLAALRAVNPSINQAELDAIATERDALLTALPAARMRLDAVRFVVSGDFLALK
jgi:ATP-dependent helicase HepA